MHAWLRKARDPGVDVCKWLWEGAPAGLNKDFSALDGLFAKVDDESEINSPDDLFTDIEAFTNYSGVETDEDVNVVLQKFRERNF